MKTRAILVAAALAVLAGCGGGSSSAADKGPAKAVELPRPRAVYALLDVTPSYPSRKAAAEKIGGVVHALGPGDRFYLIEIGGEFSPEQSVKIQCKMPSVDPIVLQPATNIQEWKARQARLDATWRKVSQAQQQIQAYLDRPIQVRDVTPLFETLRYAASRLAGEPDADRYLEVFSDFMQDSRGVKSAMPPAAAYRADGVEAFALFVPWGDNWEARTSAWSAWYVQKCGAAHFTILDAAQAKIFSLLEQNKVPKSIPKL